MHSTFVSNSPANLTVARRLLQAGSFLRNLLGSGGQIPPFCSVFMARAYELARMRLVANCAGRQASDRIRTMSGIAAFDGLARGTRVSSYYSNFLNFAHIVRVYVP
jgi:hypothetical protein